MSCPAYLLHLQLQCLVGRQNNDYKRYLIVMCCFNLLLLQSSYSFIFVVSPYLFYRHYAHRRKAVSRFYHLCRQTYYFAFRRRYCLLIYRVRTHPFSNHTNILQIPLTLLQARFLLFHNGHICIIRCGFSDLFSRCYDLYGFV